jgi:hypothetical protein
MNQQIKWTFVCILLCLFFMTACKPLQNEGGLDWATVEFSVDGSNYNNAHYASSGTSINTAIIIAVPYDITAVTISNYLTQYYDRQLQDLTNNTVSLSIPLNTPMRLAKIAFKEVCTLDHICTIQPTAYYTGISESFSINGSEESKTVAITFSVCVIGTSTIGNCKLTDT